MLGQVLNDTRKIATGVEHAVESGLEFGGHVAGEMLNLTKKVVEDAFDGAETIVKNVINNTRSTF